MSPRLQTKEPRPRADDPQRWKVRANGVPPTEYELALRKRVDELLEEAFNRASEQSQDDVP